MKNTIYLVVGSVLCLAGCSPAKVRDNLSYSPVIETQEKKQITLALETFEDKRSEGKIIGNFKDILGITLAEITTEQNIPQWITNAIKTELSNAGYSVVDAPLSDGYSINGNILRVFNKVRFGRDSSVVVEIALKKGQEVVFNKTYETHSNGTINCTDGDKTWKEYTTPSEGFKLNLQEICREVITDLNRELFSTSLN
ncbi:MAG: hypothetical protein JSR58_04040 [Verrucomicrobia bacterium]|nr:hypothetical protein [Verrucomicrobiota bacterium]